MAGKIVADTLEHSTAGSIATNYVVNGSAKAWVNFNGTGTVAIRESFSVSSISDNGTGDYTVTFSTAMTDANYSSSVTGVQRQSASGASQSSGLYSTNDVNSSGYTSSSLRVSMKQSFAVGFIDINTFCVSVFR